MKTKTGRLLKAAEMSIPKQESTVDLLRLASADLFDAILIPRDSDERIARVVVRLTRWLEVE